MHDYDGDSFKSFTGVKTRFLAEVEFGVPSKRCKNFGICRINPVTSSSDIGFSCIKVAKAIATVYDQHHIELNFMKQTITKEMYKNYFSNGTFLVEEHYHFVSLDQKSRYFRIAKGKYPIQESADALLVVFKNKLLRSISTIG